MRLTFLHLSDLHYREHWPEETELVCNRLLEDVAVQIKKFSEVYLVFSGDLVIAGEDAAAYAAFHEKFDTAFSALGIPPSRRICVPGNHDVSRSALRPALIVHEGTLGRVGDERQFNDNVGLLSSVLLDAVFANYRVEERDFAAMNACEAGLGGHGWLINETVGVYCLNTALCSTGGLGDTRGAARSDLGRLMVDTRGLHHWLNTSRATTRVLVMHHPTDWLVDWARVEIDNIIADSFPLVFSGHVHRASATFATRGPGGSVHCAAPPLFTRKSDLLGYAFVTIDTNANATEVTYRQWAPSHTFVAGTSFAGNDAGIQRFVRGGERYSHLEGPATRAVPTDTLATLEAEFDEAMAFYSAKRSLWVDRDLANMPETSQDTDTAVFTAIQELALSPRSCVVRAPKQYGLTCLGRYLAMTHLRQTQGRFVMVMADVNELPRNRNPLLKAIQARCAALQIGYAAIATLVLDGWDGDEHGRRVLAELRAEFPEIPVVLLQSVDDPKDIVSGIAAEPLDGFRTYYLWSLSRSRMRELVGAYFADNKTVDEDAILAKLVADIDALNTHRSPVNCLMLLKLLEQAFDDSPVNRTEMIGRVLYFLFYQFDKIPRYATKPDLKDCEYALGYLCEWLIRTGKPSFTKQEFFAKVQEYTTSQILDLDTEVLFRFLVTENVLVRRGAVFEFRFSYWLYFFAAHRMHHSSEFAEYILSESRYAAMPEIVEFYTGIDRRRSDAVERLTADLRRMDKEFLSRTGIPDGFNPLQEARWTPTEAALAEMERQVAESVEESSLPKAVKDAIADSHYDRARPYRQELAAFITRSSLVQLVQAMRGAARALRNCDHVKPEAKEALLEEVIRCWLRVSQVIMMISPLLAKNRTAQFEGMGFVLTAGFDEENERNRWEQVLLAVAKNVVSWFQEDLFSKKLGALFTKYINSHQTDFSELLLLLVMIRQRPPGWDKVVEEFIVRAHKNSYALSQVFSTLRVEHRNSIVSERVRQTLRRLTAMAVAKHATGARHPNTKLIEKAAKQFDAEAGPSSGQP